MNSSEITRLLNDTVDLLSQTSTMKGLCRRHRHGDPLPSGQVLAEVIDLCRAVLFPGYYGKSVVNADTVLYTIGVSVERLFFLLRHQIEAGLCFENDDDSDQAHADMHLRARSMAAELIRRLPGIRAVLSTDVEAAYLGDPAAGSFGEVISADQLPRGARALPHRRAAAAAHSNRNGTQRDGYRHTSRRTDRKTLYNRPRHGRGDRSYQHNRRQRETVPGRYARSTQLPARRERQPYQKHTATPYTRGRRDSLFERLHTGTHKNRQRCRNRR